MPFVINNTRATISEDFKLELIKMWRGQYAAMKEKLEYASGSQKQYMLAQFAVPMSRIKGLCTDKHLLDLELARLRSLPFDEFSIFEGKDGRNQNARWIVAQTKDITIANKWDAGPYRIYMPVNISSIGIGSSNFHFIPNRDPKTRERHPHHTAYFYGCVYSDEVNEYVYFDAHENGTNMTANTCWSEFAGPMATTIAEGDFVAALQHVYIFLTRYNAGSPLVRIQDIHHLQRKTK